MDDVRFLVGTVELVILEMTSDSTELFEVLLAVERTGRGRGKCGGRGGRIDCFVTRYACMS